jgi:D-threo-aldose 1-dehydrogenase
VALLHDPDAHAEQALREAYPALERLRAEGVIGAIGIGMNQSSLPARFVRETDIDVVLLAGLYTLLDRDGLAELLPEAVARGRSVLIGGVFNSGLLTAPRPGATYDYGPAPQPVLDRALRLLAVCERHGLPLRAAALRFPFGHPAVASVLTGARSPQEVHDTVEQLRRPIPDVLWDELRAEGLLAADILAPVATPSGKPFRPGHDLRKRRSHLSTAPGAQYHPARVDGHQSPEPVPLRLPRPTRLQSRIRHGGGQYRLRQRHAPCLPPGHRPPA